VFDGNSADPSRHAVSHEEGKVLTDQGEEVRRAQRECSLQNAENDRNRLENL